MEKDDLLKREGQLLKDMRILYRNFCLWEIWYALVTCTIIGCILHVIITEHVLWVLVWFLLLLIINLFSFDYKIDEMAKKKDELMEEHRFLLENIEKFND